MQAGHAPLALQGPIAVHAFHIIQSGRPLARGWVDGHLSYF